MFRNGLRTGTTDLTVGTVADGTFFQRVGATIIGALTTVGVRLNSGADIGTRHRLNFIEGSNIGLTITDDAVNSEVAVRIEGIGTRAQNVLLLANQNDWTPHATWPTMDVLRLSLSGSGKTISGFVAITQGSGSFVKVIINTSSAAFCTLLNESTASTAANRIRCPRNRDFALNQFESCILYYNASVSRWWVLAIASLSQSEVLRLISCKV